MIASCVCRQKLLVVCDDDNDEGLLMRTMSTVLCYAYAVPESPQWLCWLRREMRSFSISAMFLQNKMH